MAVGHVASVTFHGAAVTSATSDAINTTDATLLTVFWAGADRSVTVTDSKGNTYSGWTTKWNGAAGVYMMACYCENPTVGSGHTFTVTTTTMYAGVAASAFSGVKTSGAYHAQAGASQGYQGYSIGSGSITTIDSGALVVTGTGLHADNGTAPTIDTGFAIVAHAAGLSGNYYGIDVAWLDKATAGAVAPTWSSSAANLSASVMMDFAPTATTAAPFIRERSHRTPNVGMRHG